ncbi:ESPR-type extended signal peptide-containing protein, partial [Acinetobacter sp. 99]
MNKIYRLVWNKSLSLWTVVSENARGATKKRNVAASISIKTEIASPASTYQQTLLKPTLIALTISSVFWSAGAFAAANTSGGTSNNGSSMAISPSSSQCGAGVNEATINGGNGTAVGCGNDISGTDPTRAQNMTNRRGSGVVAYGRGVPVGASSGSVHSASTAVGRQNIIKGAGGATAIGTANNSDTSAGFHNVLVGQGNSTVGTGGYNILMGIGNQVVDDPTGTPDGTGIGTNSIAIGVANRVTGQTSIAFGRQTIADADYSIAQGNTATVNKGATGGVALGHSATVSGQRGIAIGSSNSPRNYDPATAPNATGADSIAMGTNATGNANDSVAIGRRSNAANKGAIAIGAEASTASSNTNNGQSIAIGEVAQASGDQSVALGANTRAVGDSSIAIGGDDVNRLALNSALSAEYTQVTGGTLVANVYPTTEARQGATAVGVQAVATGNFSSAYGLTSKATGTASSAFGVQANAAGLGAVAFGAVSQAIGHGSLAMGVNATASGNDSTAIGSGNAKELSARATADGATAVGHRSLADALRATAIGQGAQSTADDATAIGTDAQAQSSNDIAIGSNAATAEGTEGDNIAMGNGVTTGATGKNVSIGSDGTTANSETAEGGAVAIGRDQIANGDGAVAIGDPNRASGSGAVALGKDNTAAGDTAASTMASGAVAIGNTNQAIGQGSVALGNTSIAAAAGAIALGDTANAQATRGVALGSGATATNADDVALGAGSVTEAANPTANGTVGGITYGYAGTTPSSVVSVGSAGNERQITNVAAGRVSETSTDAINGSQLYSTQQALGNLADSTANHLGGGSTVNPDGTISAPSYIVNETPINNVGDAIEALDQGWNLQTNGADADAIKAGDTVDIGTVDDEENLTVTKAGNTIQYGLNKDLKVDSVTAGGTVINDNGVTISNGPSITKDGIDAADNRITNVADGAAPSDAVNKGQLDKAAATAKTEVTEGKNISVTETIG